MKHGSEWVHGCGLVCWAPCAQGAEEAQARCLLFVLLFSALLPFSASAFAAAAESVVFAFLLLLFSFLFTV